LYDNNRYRASSLILLRGTVASQSGRLRAAVFLTLPDERERRSPIVLDVRQIVIQSCNTKLNGRNYMTALKRIMSLLALLGLLALYPAASGAWAAETDPTILAAVDSAIAAINAGSVADAKAAYTDAPAAIIDDFPPFLWSGKNAVEDYSRDLKAVLTKYGITDWRFQRHQPRYILATEDRAWLVVPTSFPFLLGGKTQSVSADWVFVLAKIDGKWRVDSSVFADTHHTLLP
jgi:hypothetical protein